MTTIATEAKTATFDTRRPGLTLVLVPERAERRNEFDQVLRAHRPRQAVQFSEPGSEDGVLEIRSDTQTEACDPCDGTGQLIRDGQIETCPRCDGDGTRTRQVTRANGVVVDLPFDTVIARLREHDMSNTPRGFWERGNAPEEPLPRARDQIAAIVKASIDLDLEAVERVIAIEQETQNRDDVIRQARDAIEQIQTARAQAVADEPTTQESESADPGETD